MPSVSSPEPPLRDPLVLVVEDEFLLALDLELVLERHGFRVLGPTATVAQALRLLEDGEPPDVALLDVNLKGEMVTPVAEALRARGVPFVLASAYDGHKLGGGCSSQSAEHRQAHRRATPARRPGGSRGAVTVDRPPAPG